MVEGRSPRWGRGEFISAISALMLLIIMFALQWYGVDGIPGRTSSRSGIVSSENAWHGLPGVRWLMLVTIGVALGSVLLHANQHAHGSRTSTGAAITLLGGVTAGFLIVRVLIDLPSPREVPDQKLGAVLGVISAIGIAAGGFDTLRHERARARALVQRSRAPLASRASAR